MNNRLTTSYRNSPNFDTVFLKYNLDHVIPVLQRFGVKLTRLIRGKPSISLFALRFVIYNFLSPHVWVDSTAVQSSTYSRPSADVQVSGRQGGTKEAISKASNKHAEFCTFSPDSFISYQLQIFVQVVTTTDQKTISSTSFQNCNYIVLSDNLLIFFQETLKSINEQRRGGHSIIYSSKGRSKLI